MAYRKHRRAVDAIRRRALLCAVIALGCFSSINAQQPTPGNGDVQFWPEIDFSIKLNQRISVLSLATLHFGKNVSDLNEEQIGFGFSFSLTKYFSFSPAYRFGRQQPPGRLHTQEHRFSLDFTARAPFKRGFLISDRNRGELRRIKGTDSGRYRNRLQLERTLRISEFKVTPYFADEVFYDSRLHLWNRNRIYAGVRVPLNEHFGIDAYFLEQHDARDRPLNRRHVMGLNLRVDY